jgi:cytochrome b subunit of formate dehydrogenase
MRIPLAATPNPSVKGTSRKLERKEHWGLLLVGVCCGVTGLAALFSPSFAIVFAASSIVGLPVILLLFSPSSISARLRELGDFGRIVFFAALFGYIALSKKVLVPFVVSAIEHALS